MNPDARGSLRPETREKLLALTTESARLTGSSVGNLFTARANRTRALLPEEQRLLNATELVLLAWFETACLVHDIVYHNSGIRANLYARFLILSIHESAQRLTGLGARQLRQDVAAVLPTQFDDAALKQAHSELTRVANRSRARFSGVRHGIVAHRDADPDTRMKLLLEADLDEVVNAGGDMLEALAKFGPLIVAFTAHLSDRRPEVEEPT